MCDHYGVCHLVRHKKRVTRCSHSDLDRPLRGLRGCKSQLPTNEVPELKFGANTTVDM